MTTFGKTTDGSSTATSSADKMAVSTATPTATETVATATARVWLSSSGSTSIKAVIYSDSSGNPGTLLAESDAVTLTQTSEAAVDCTFSGANRITVTSGTAYWVGLAWQDPGSPSVTLSRDNTASGRQEQTFTWPTLPTTFGSGTTLTGPVDVYVTTIATDGGGFLALL